MIKTIKKSIDINAPKEKVYRLLIDDSATREWYAEFNPGAYADTDWKQGSDVMFKDGEGNGIAGKIIENTPGKAIVIEFDAMVSQGKINKDGEELKEFAGTREEYHLSQQGNATRLDISSDMTEEYYDMMSEKWDKALQVLKRMAEEN